MIDKINVGKDIMGTWYVSLITLSDGVVILKEALSFENAIIIGLSIATSLECSLIEGEK